MTTRSVDQVNIGLMVLSCLLAFLFPFQLFLFSFAVLGPLHYFTEIPWLQRKQYFTTGKYDFLILIAICAAIATVFYMTPQAEISSPPVIRTMGILSFTAFFLALVMTTMKLLWQKIAALALIGASAIIFSQMSLVAMVFANFIPTIIHVYIFTGAFILLGALKNRSTTGIVSLVVFGLCTALFFLLTPDPQLDRSLSESVKSSYLLFAGLNFDLMNLFHLQSVTPESPNLYNILFDSNAGIIIMRLIAFSYTYHFLNWFSKTSVIKWHQISKRGIAIVLVLWIASLVLYAMDFAIALRYLYVMSLLHVVLEFPLNHRTFISIGSELRSRFSKKTVTAQ